MAFVKSESENELRIIWIVSILSTLFGLSLAYWMHEAPDSPSPFFLGLAHAIVFAPVMIIAEVRVINIIIASIVCALFPIWGFLWIGALSFVIGAPLTNSLVWGAFVAIILKRPMANLIFLVIGAISNAGLFMFMGQSNSVSNTDGGIAETIGFWYILTLPAFPILFQYRWREQPPMSVCDSCGFSCQEPEPMPFCPKCGHKKGDQSVALKDSN